MQRIARVWMRSQRVAVATQQPQRQALKSAVVAASCSNSNSSSVQRVATGFQQLQTRSFQTSSVLLQEKDNTTKPSSSESDSESEIDSDDEDDVSDSDSDDEEEQDEDKKEEEDLTLSDVDDEAQAEGQAMASQYLGVTYTSTKVKKYSAELEMDGIVISGGAFWTALDAAKGYDELIDLYCDLDTPRNFPAGSDAAETAAAALSHTPSSAEAAAAAAAVEEWQVPDAGKRNADIIPPIMGKYLTLDEVLSALEREKAINVYTVDLAGKSSLADYMIFTTGRSMAHMKRMADMMIQSMKVRDLKDDFEYSVEGRDCDDWMIADCSNIVVHFMREDTRRILNLEDHWDNMVNDKHRVYGDMNEEEYMDRFGTSELMEYLEEDTDFTTGDDGDRQDGSGVEWK